MSRRTALAAIRRPGPGRGTHPRGRKPVAVIGAGPYGLATAAHLSGVGTPHRVSGEPSAGRRAVSLEEFLDYGKWFQRRVVPEAERKKVLHVEAVEGGFGLALDTGEDLVAGRVVVATGLASPLCAHRDLSSFRGRRATILGSGRSALESAVLLHEAGARPAVVTRCPAIVFGDAPSGAGRRGRRSSLRARPGSAPGRGWSLLACRRAAAAHRRLPPALRRRLLHTALPDEDSVLLTLRRPDGETEVIAADHVLVATGYRVDVELLRFVHGTEFAAGRIADAVADAGRGP